MTTLTLGSITVDVVKKDIKNVHLSVCPPAGDVRISAPLRMNLETIRVFAVSKLGWIKEQRKKIVGQERETPRSYAERESHYVWGKRYLMKVVERDCPAEVFLQHNRIVLQVRPTWSRERRQEFLDAWYRRQIRAAVPEMIRRWESVLGVKVERVFVRRMRTKWGSCSRASASVRLNTDLAKKPPECLEYIVVHEMAHLIEPTHNARFLALMDRAMPNWQHYREMLNRLPVRYENWECQADRR
jgi:predicted metal-dependent hydrolase